MPWSEQAAMSSTYLVIGRTDEALRMSKAVSLKKWPHLVDAADMVPLAKLCAFLSGDKYDKVIGSFVDQIPEQPDVEPWDFENLLSPVYLIPEAYVRAIADMRDEDLPALAKKWSKIEEFKWHKPDPSDLQDQLVSLRAFAGECIKKKKSLLLLLTT
jgi:hypothetical protein